MKKILIGAVVAVLIFTGCELFTRAEYSTVFTINGVVRNGATGALVSGATILWTTFDNPEGLTFTTSANGVFNISPGEEGVNAPENGDYTLQASMSGYTRDAVQVTVDGTSVLIPEMGLTEYRSTENVELVIYPKSVPVTFNLRFTDDNFGNQNTYSNIMVYARMIDPDTEVADPYNPEYDGSINADGLVSFSSLPAAPAVKFGCREFFDSYGNYYAAQEFGTFDLTGQPNYKIASKLLVPEATSTDPVVLVSNLDDNFGVTDDIELTFSKALDTENTTFYVNRTGNGTNIPVSSTWATDNKSVTLALDEALAVNTGYSLIATLVSEDGFVTVYDTAGVGIAFTTEHGIEYLASNILSYDYDSNRLAIDADLTVQFTKSIDRVEDVILYLGTDNTGTIVQTDASFVDSTLTVAPVGDLNYNRSYILYGTVYGSADNATDVVSFNDTSTVVLSFSTAEEVITPATPGTPVISVPGNYDYNDTTIAINFDETADAEGYYAYARVVGSGTDWFNVGYTASAYQDFDYGQGTLSASISADLSVADYASYFDVFVDDAIQTPFAESQEVEFKVIAENAGVFSADSNTVQKGDTVLPDAGAITYPTNWTSGFVDTGAVTQLIFTVPLTEYITGLPTTGSFTLNALGAAAVTTSAWTANSPSEITFTVNLPAGVTITNSSYILFSVTDSSGNSQNIQLGFTAGGVREVTNP